MVRLSNYFALICLTSIVVLVIIVVSQLHRHRLHSSVLRYRMVDEFLVDEREPSDTKTILFWTKFFEDPYWDMKAEAFRKGFLESVECPVTNCVFTSERNLLAHEYEYDAIVFHAPEPLWDPEDLPKARSPHQVYIMASKECPAEIKNDLNAENDFYNLTMTYRLDSDIGWHYGSVVDIASGKRIAPAVDVPWRKPDEDFMDNEILRLVKGKQKSAAWFVSHCGAYSGRDELARRIQDFTDVDVYGKCGSLSCPRWSSVCDEMLNTTYRFYFAFENSLCIDYLTEKVYDTINSFVIPVIYSGADLSRFLPPKSYINAETFRSPEDLVTFLKVLEENPHEYMKYFWWRKHYKLSRRDDVDLCAICKKLNEPNFSAKRLTYLSVKDWFYKDSCRKPKIKF